MKVCACKCQAKEVRVLESVFSVMKVFPAYACLAVSLVSDSMVYLRSNEAKITLWMVFSLNRLQTKGAFHQRLLTRGAAACIAIYSVPAHYYFALNLTRVGFKNSETVILKWTLSAPNISITGKIEKAISM